MPCPDRPLVLVAYPLDSQWVAATAHKSWQKKLNSFKVESEGEKPVERLLFFAM
jgi:hypothetical protein